MAWSGLPFKRSHGVDRVDVPADAFGDPIFDFPLGYAFRSHISERLVCCAEWTFLAPHSAMIAPQSFGFQLWNGSKEIRITFWNEPGWTSNLRVPRGCPSTFDVLQEYFIMGYLLNFYFCFLHLL